MIIIVITVAALGSLGVYVLSISQVHKHFHYVSPLIEEQALTAVQGSMGGHLTDGDVVEVPLGAGRIMSVVTAPTPGGTAVEVWLSTYDFKNAGIIRALKYRSLANKVRQAVQA